MQYTYGTQTLNKIEEWQSTYDWLLTEDSELE